MLPIAHQLIRLITIGLITIGILFQGTITLANEDKEGKKLGVDLFYGMNLEDFQTKITENTKHFKINNEFLNPHIPSRFEFKPETVTLPDSLKEHWSESSILMEFLTPEKLLTLSSLELKDLLDHLSKIKMKIKWSDQNGRKCSGRKFCGVLPVSSWDETNAASALFLYVRSKQDNEKFLSTILAAHPIAIVSGLPAKTLSILDVQLVARTLINIISKLDATNTSQVSTSLSTVVAGYVRFWANDAPGHMWALSRLVLTISNCINKLSLHHQIEFSNKQKGVLLGGMLSGALKNSFRIKSIDERKLWVINSISNLTWAATTLLGAIPIAGPVVAGLAGGVSIAVVTWALIYNKLGTRDFSPGLKEIEGYIEFAVLEQSQASLKDHKIIALELLAWMRATVHVNGLGD